MSKRVAAVAYCFVVLGVMQGQVGSRLPALKRDLSLSNGLLALVLMADDVGQLLLLSLAGAACQRFGPPAVARFSTLALCLSLPLAGFATGPVGLAVALSLYGGSGGSLDVAMNTEATELDKEDAGRHSLFSRLHALFSLGFGLGGVTGGAAAGAGQGPAADFLAASAAVLLCAPLFLPWLGQPRSSGAGCPSHSAEANGLAVALNSDGEEGKAVAAEASGPQARLAVAFTHPRLLLVGAVCFIASVGEGSMGDWATVYFHGVLGTDEAWAPAGFVAFNVAMTLVRLAGDHAIARFRPHRMLVFGGAVAGSGLFLATLAPANALGRWAAGIGFAGVGLGLGCVVPIGFSAAAKVPGVDPGVGIGIVSTLGYAGMLVGPPLIGGIAHLLGNLRFGIALDGALALLLVVLAPLLRT